MKKIKLYLPLIILAVILATAAIAVYKSNIKQNLGKENFTKSKTLFLQGDAKIKNIFDNKDPITAKDFNNSDKKYKIVNIFASWCSSCFKEHGELLNLKNNFSNITVIGIAWNDHAKITKNFLEKYGNPYQKVGLDTKGYLDKILGVRAVPETFVVNPEGIIIKRHQGILTIKDVKNILLLIN
tara:strand:- start:5090 stop:5638 length:549 start_codon:yes stop_codon:yes gene_type:complete